MFGLLLLAASADAAGTATRCEWQDQLLGKLAASVEMEYVDEARAGEFAAQIRVWRESSRYSGDCAEIGISLQKLNRDLDMLDGHFHVEPSAPADQQDDWLLAWRKSGPAVNFGIRDVAVLDGNVGYLRLASFYPWDQARPQLGSALDLLRHSDALILDLRQNGGGDDRTASHLVSAFLAPSVESVQEVVSRTGVQEEKLPAPADRLTFPSGPLVILIDRRSASAAEFVAYSLQKEGRATVIGSRSAGAANLMGEPVALGGGFQAIIPNATPQNRVSGGNWESVGVQPDIPGGDDPVFAARMHIARIAADR